MGPARLSRAFLSKLKLSAGEHLKQPLLASHGRHDTRHKNDVVE